MYALKSSYLPVVVKSALETPLDMIFLQEKKLNKDVIFYRVSHRIERKKIRIS